jgi:hypothetical protein
MQNCPTCERPAALVVKRRYGPEDPETKESPVTDERLFLVCPNARCDALATRLYIQTVLQSNAWA